MNYRGRLLVSVVVGWLLAASSAFAQQDQQDLAHVAREASAPTEIQIWKAIIAESIASYPHSCPCPYSPNRAGQACGERSAYSRVAGASGSLMCYPQDIPEREIARYRERMQ